MRPRTIHARRVAAFSARRGALGDQRRQARADWSADRGARLIVHAGRTGRRRHASVVDEPVVLAVSPAIVHVSVDVAKVAIVVAVEIRL